MNVDWPPLQKSASLAWISSHSLAWYCSGTGSAAQKKRLKPWKRRENLEQYRKPEVFLGLLTTVAASYPTWQRSLSSYVAWQSQLARAETLGYLDKDAPTLVIADASPVGLGAVLTQKQRNGDRNREKIFADRERGAGARMGLQKSSIPMCMVCHLILLQFTSRRKLSTAEGQNPVHALKDGCYECSHTNSRWCMSLDRVTLLTSSQG